MDIASLICVLMLISGFLLWLDDCKRDNAEYRSHLSASTPPHSPPLPPAQTRMRRISFPELDSARGSAEMELSTYVYMHDEIISFARVDFTRDGSTDFNLENDFSKTLHHANIQATQENLDAQHANAFSPEAIDAFKSSALFWYAHRHNF
jgi:hypothetical protein